MTATLKTLTVHRFRNLAPDITLRFRDGFNVLVGKNATGKTTLLDVIAAARSLDFSKFAREPFSFSFQVTSGNKSLAVEVENVHRAQKGKESARSRPVTESGEPALSRRLTEGVLTPRVSITLTKRDRVVLRTAVTEGRVTQEVSGKRDSTERTTNTPVFDRNLLLPTLMVSPPRTEEWINEVVSLVREFWVESRVERLDESLGYFDRVVTGPDSAIHVFSWEADPAPSKEKGPVRLFTHTVNAPSEFGAEALKLLSADNELATLQFRETPLLSMLAQQMGFRSATLYAQREEKSAEKEPWRASFSAFRFEFTRHDRSTISHHWLSYGQKRLVAFYYWLATYPSLVVADELVNGLHHAWIDGCVAAIQGRQAFLTTQNPLLLDYLPFETEGEVAEAFVICKSALEAGGEFIHWNNIGEKDAHSFYRAYKTGIQNVSEILATRGLW